MILFNNVIKIFTLPNCYFRKGTLIINFDGTYVLTLLSMFIILGLQLLAIALIRKD